MSEVLPLKNPHPPVLIWRRLAVADRVCTFCDKKGRQRKFLLASAVGPALICDVCLKEATSMIALKAPA